MNEFILGPQKATGSWFDATLLTKAKLHGEACPAIPPTEANALNSFMLTQYYDLPRSLYTAYARTGDTAFQSLARKCADAQWKHPDIQEGKRRQWPDSVSPVPRHVGAIGLILRAIDGRPEMWEWLVGYVTFHFMHWCRSRTTATSLFYGLREGAFCLEFAVALARVLPDSYPLQSGPTATNGAAVRAQLLSDIEAVCLNYYGRLQQADGSWRWDDFDSTDSDGGTLKGIMQPFMVGLLLHALTGAHQLVTSPTAKESIKNQILRACRHLYSDGPYVKDQVEVKSGKRIRGFHYLFHGGTTVNPTKYVQGDMRFPWTAVEAWWLPSARQAISTIAGAFGYAFKISGDEFYRTAGNELWDSAYSGNDGVRAMMDDTAKNFNQHVWGTSSYQAYLQGTTTAPPPPPVEPSVPVVAITSHSNGAVLAGSVTVTATVTDKNVITSAHLVVDEVVIATVKVAPYNFTLDTKRLNDGAHTVYVRAWNSLGKAGDSAKVSVMVKNAVVAPNPPRAVEWPKQISKQNTLIETQWKERFRLKGIREGITNIAEFEKVS